jgi:type IV pilus assembly protein PilM
MKFMFNLRNKNIGPIGLDLGHNSIKMIQLAWSDDKICVVAAEEADYVSDMNAADETGCESVVLALKGMLAKGTFSGREVVSCLSNDSLKIKSLRLDTTDPQQIEQQFKTEVAPRFGLDTDTDEIRYMIAGNVYQGDEMKNEVIFFGMDKAGIAQHLGLLEDAGLTPVGIDAVPCALFRSFQVSQRRHEDQQLVSVLVDVGSLFTTVIIGRGQEIIFVKQIPIAGERLNADVASKLEVTVAEAGLLRAKLKNDTDGSMEAATRQAVIDAMSRTIEELAKEISLCFRYYAVTFRGQRPTEVVFAGGEADETTLLKALKRHLGVSITIAGPLRGFDLSHADFKDRHDAEMSKWAVAVGLGMKGMDLSTCES